MTNLQVAKEIITKLNRIYEENIFELRYPEWTITDINESVEVVNSLYEYEGNDVLLVVESETEIDGNTTGAGVVFNSVDNVCDQIDQLFINED